LRKISAPPRFDSRTVQSVASAIPTTLSQPVLYSGSGSGGGNSSSNSSSSSSSKSSSSSISSVG
jgi:hypothetical protein